MIDNTKEYIICSAIKRIKIIDIPSKQYNSDIDICCLGFRHHDILIAYEGVVSKNPYAQGFFTSKGRFVNRIEAKEIALNCGQIGETNHKLLFSEDIY